MCFKCFYDTHNFVLCKNAVEKDELSEIVGAPLVLAVCKVESGFDKNAVSDKGAKGVMQLMDDTFSFVSEKYELGFFFDDVFDLEKNLAVGIRYLLYLKEKFNDETTVLCAYNAGEGNVYKWLYDTRYSSDGKAVDHIPFPETENFVKKVKYYKKVYENI